MKDPAMNPFALTGKRALVTGARTGLGQAIVLALAEAGADIVGLGSRPMPETATKVGAAGRAFKEVVRDLSDTQGLGGLVEQVIGEVGPIDILVNNAGTIRRADFVSFAEKDWDEVMAINLKSPFLLSQAVARHMIERRIPGRIISIASLLSFQGGIRVPSYTASKHGIIGLTKLMANELAPHGITVNAIAPGYMATDNTTALREDPERARAILERIPLGRWGQPDDLATAVVFLAAPGSGYVTGTILPVDGGWLAR
jgi:2-deoxy-D-gluconate 3-dehydrogenase